ncbi:MAG: hypothetical protein BWY05_01587 [Euryarchaeota archaeon ADurb.Bin165]|nr:MAG: hypothetical protein BWY05_01587 [Euryarchaeota archaeon ADurb.Bin165]
MSVVPSPKSHAHIVGPPTERSVNFTLRGAVPDAGSALNLASMMQEGSTIMYFSFTFVLEPAVGLLTVRVTVYFPGLL